MVDHERRPFTIQRGPELTGRLIGMNRPSMPKTIIQRRLCLSSTRINSLVELIV